MKGIKEMLEEAEAALTRVTVEEALVLHGADEVVFVDVRDPRELERDGTIEGVFRCTRGMLEFWIDPASPYHKPIFAEDKRFIFYCAMGWRSSLAAKTAQEMGLAKATDLVGGFKAWREAGGRVEPFAVKVGKPA